MRVLVSNLGTVEKKVLGALLMLANDNMEVETTLKEIAQKMGYKRTGGAITYAMQALEMKNYLVTSEQGKYKLLL